MHGLRWETQGLVPAHMGEDDNQDLHGVYPPPAKPLAGSDELTLQITWSSRAHAGMLPFLDVLSGMIIHTQGHYMAEANSLTHHSALAAGSTCRSSHLLHSQPRWGVLLVVSSLPRHSSSISVTVLMSWGRLSL